MNKARKTSFLALLIMLWSPAFAQDSNDVIQALRQQREEALDKVANAYVTIMKLQRELDRLNAVSQQKPEAPPKASADAPSK